MRIDSIQKDTLMDLLKHSHSASSVAMHIFSQRSVEGPEGRDKLHVISIESLYHIAWLSSRPSLKSTNQPKSMTQINDWI